MPAGESIAAPYAQVPGLLDAVRQPSSRADLQRMRFKTLLQEYLATSARVDVHSTSRRTTSLYHLVVPAIFGSAEQPSFGPDLPLATRRASPKCHCSTNRVRVSHSR